MDQRHCKIRIGKATDDDINVLSNIIRISYQDVAQTFKLTKANCPKHPSNCTDKWIKNDMEENLLNISLKKQDKSIQKL